MTGRTSEACDVIGLGRDSVVTAARSLETLIHCRLVIASGSGKRFRSLQLSPIAYEEMTRKFAAFPAVGGGEPASVALRRI